MTGDGHDWRGRPAEDLRDHGQRRQLHPGDRLAVVNQSPAEATLADISITLKGTRTS